MGSPPQRRRVWILTRHYPPDVGALAYRVEHLARVLSQDYQVTVLASQPNRYRDAPRAARREQSGAITIRRVSSMPILRSRSKAGRLLTELLGAITMSLVALRHRRKIDVVFSSTPPFFYALPGLVMKRLGRRPLVLDIRDLWLDWAEETRLVRSGVVLSILRAFERAAIRSADHITLTTEGFRRLLLERHDVAPARATVVFNGLDDGLVPEAIAPARPRRPGEPLRVLYAGNLGPSQNLLGIRDGLAASLAKWEDLVVTVVGEGSQRDELASIGHERLHVVPHVDRAALVSLYQKADAFLLHLADLEVYRHTVPSKIFEYIAFERPILCGVRGEAREIAFRHAECFGFGSDDSASFSAAVDRLCSGAEPDNTDEPRADRSEILRSSRDSRWLQVFASVS